MQDGNAEAIRLVSVRPHSGSVEVRYVMGGVSGRLVIAAGRIDGKGIRRCILGHGKREVTDLVKVGDQVFPIQVDQDVDQYEGRPRTKENIPFNIRHRKRFRNEAEGMDENDFDGLAGGTRNQNRGMGTDQSYSIPGQGMGGAALGY